jgi:hypothetical protein
MAAFNPETATVKTRHAIAHAQAMARDLGHPEVNSIHLLMAALQQEGGLTRPLLERAGAHGAALERAAKAELAKQPRVSGGDVGVTRELRELLDLAATEAESLHDRFVSTEHLLLGALSDKAAKGRVRAAQLLQSLGVSRDLVLSALAEVRGTQRVEDENPEASTRRSPSTPRPDRARPPGKLDPVIGRDEEIRRAMQVLSRRTKNNPVLIGEPGVGKTAIAEGSPSASPAATSPRPEGQARAARPRRAGRRRQVPRRVRGAPQGRAQGSRGRRAARSSSSSTSCTRSSAPAAEGAQDAAQPAQAGARARRAALHRRDHARRVPQAHREGQGARAALPAGLRRRALGRGHDRDPPWA